ncbi:MAG TPA: dTDP-4-dehydrorhamnose reductase [Solirubrobacteraceae bacterium]|jgi:dTDP-4-dehydrorhamnose reductase|nr:dTDP-4-dehydrorhamnose reductase [Solirubrobacteraceae bacterium]
MQLLVSGAGGMLGAAVMRAGDRSGHSLVGLSHAQLDVTDAAAVSAAFARVAPDAAINCAAWTDVDGAEQQRERARLVNADGAGNLARAAAAAGAALVHVSSDYVFPGTAPLDGAGRPRPYVESDATGPRSAYGITKLEGERQVLAASAQHAVVRSAWLFGLGGGNFVATMLRLAAEHQRGEPSVRVVTDQIGSPTWTGHLAPALVGLAEREVAGIVHLAGAGAVSWHDFAVEIFRQAEVPCRVLEATSEEIARPAPRPAWSALASEREDVLPMPDWRDGLAGYLAARAGMMRA